MINNQKIIKLSPPQLSNEHIKEKVICIRAHRERIFKVSSEMLDGKLIMHNYGQGGAGWTFLFGCVDESIRQFTQQIEQSQLTNQPIAVIGAGCYGLLTAITLARTGHKVRLIADQFENISSFKSAGFFFPRWRKCSTPEEIAVFKARGMESYATYLDIINGKHPFIKTGPKILPAYYSPDIDPGFGPYITEGLVNAPDQVIIDFGTGKQYQVMRYETVFINSSEIMRQLEMARNDLGIPITAQHIESFDQVTEPIIFNCAGLGAKELAGDARIVPVQGHLITLKDQPDMNALQYMLNVKVVQTTPKGGFRDELIYFAPKESGILGVTFIRGQDSLASNEHEFDRIISRCRVFF